MLLTAALLLAGGCAGRLTQFFPDTYYAKDGVYQNEALGFALMYSGVWRIWTDPREMDRNRRAAARVLQAQRIELLYAGETLDGTHGTRAIAEHMNMEAPEYFAVVRAANAAAIEQDYGSSVFLAPGVSAIKWEYSQAGYRYAEFLFKTGTVNVRIAFWTTPERYERFVPEYEQILLTLNLRPGM